MSIKFVNTPSLEGMDAQITPVVGENPLCRIPSVRALYTAVSRQELMDHKPGTVQGFVLAFEEGLKNIVFANLDCRHDHFKLVNTVAEAVRTAVEMHSQNIFVPVGTDFTDEEVSLICQGLMIGAYRFDLYKTEKSPKVRFTVYSERDYSAAVQNGKMLGECTNLARDLVNRGCWRRRLRPRQNCAASSMRFSMNLRSRRWVWAASWQWPGAVSTRPV